MDKKSSIKKRLPTIILLLIFMIAIFFAVTKTISKYETMANSNGNMNIAFYLLSDNYQELPICLSDLEPRQEPYVYNFTISNNDGSKRTETALEYDLSIKTTTNLPLTFDLFLNETYNQIGAESIITSNIIDLDEDETYFRTIKAEEKEFGFSRDETNNYQLIIYFPETYKDIEYQDIIEYVEIIVDSKQKID